MKEYTIRKLKSLRHLSDYTIEEVIASLGLYEPVLIDPNDIITDEIGKGSNHKILFLPGKDVQFLYTLKSSNTPIMLPCAYCKKEQPFKNEAFLSYTEGICKTIQVGSQRCKIEALDSYFDQSMKINGFNVEQFHESHLEISKATNRKNVIDRFSHFSNTYICQLDSDHVINTHFTVEEIDVTDELTDDNRDDYIRFNGCLIMKKIGQYPSMADMQFFDSIKYKKILKDSYRDYTMALGLFASGIGAGSFLYLRRVLEKLVEEAHQLCKDNDKWNELDYVNARFIDKIYMIEATGEVIIPKELAPIKSKLYGVLSKGVHESGEEECKELFPYVKITIDLILEAKLLVKERKEKIKNIQDKLQEQ